MKPCLFKAVKQVLGVEASKKIQELPLSNNNVRTLIDTMSNDIADQLVCEIKNLYISVFSVMRVPTLLNAGKLLVYVRYLGDNNTIKEAINNPRVGNNIESKRCHENHV